MTSTGRFARRGRLRRGVEYAVLFYGLVGAWTLLPDRVSPIPPLVVLAVGVLVYLLRQPDFDRADLWRVGALRAELASILLLWAGAAALTAAAVLMFRPDRLFGLPREAPLSWTLIVVLYPFFSVYPQELIFRAFLMRRYRPVFGSGRGLVAASAVAFGFAHVIFGNLVSVALTLAGGWLFARRYQRSRSLLVTSVEHALYGILVFTVGLADLFYHGAADIR